MPMHHFLLAIAASFDLCARVLEGLRRGYSSGCCVARLEAEHTQYAPMTERARSPRFGE